ncbi:MAG: hypothetical protein ACRENE_25610 [Polyangiaceae bacterium]
MSLPRLRPFASCAPCIAAAAVVALPACLQGEDIDLGRNVEAGGPLVGLEAGPDAGATSDASTSASPVLSAGISATRGTICAGACVDLTATATGLDGPFTYTWGQGLGSGAGKSVCPMATTTYSVLVTAFPTELEATAAVQITVVPCDGGSPTPPPDSGSVSTPPDAGSMQSHAAALCVPNPSFEGTPTIGTTGPPGTTPTGAPPQWQVCQGAPDVGPSLSLLPASNGMTYAGLAVGTGSLSYMTASIGTTLCSPLAAGTTYSFCLDLGVGVRGVMQPLTMGDPPPVLELWGGQSACSQDAMLWTSTGISNLDSWKTACGTFVAPRALTTLTLLPAQSSSLQVAPGTWSYVVVDNLVAGP